MDIFLFHVLDQIRKRLLKIHKCERGLKLMQHALVTCFPALGTGCVMFSSALSTSCFAFPRLAPVVSCFPARDTLAHISSLVASSFPAPGTGGTFSCAWHRLFSRAWHRLYHAFPRLTSVVRFPALGTGCMVLPRPFCHLMIPVRLSVHTDEHHLLAFVTTG